MVGASKNIKKPFIFGAFISVVIRFRCVRTKKEDKQGIRFSVGDKIFSWRVQKTLRNPMYLKRFFRWSSDLEDKNKVG